MANRRPGWKQARVVRFESPMTIVVQLTHSGQEVTAPYAEASIECRRPGARVWWRYDRTWQVNEIEAQD